MYTEIKLLREVEKERRGRKRDEENKCLVLSKLNKLLQEVCKRES